MTRPTEIEKLIAFRIAQIGHHWGVPDVDKKTAHAALELYLDNAEDLELLAWADNNGLEYVAMGGAEYPRKVMHALLAVGEMLPHTVKEKLQKEWQDWKLKEVKTKVIKGRLGFIYLGRSPITPYTKIGFSGCPKKRASTLRAGIAGYTMLWVSEKQFTMDKEAQLHIHFALKHVEGEWFNLTESEIEEAKGMCQL